MSMIKIGSYGKLPAHGDFIGRDLNKGFLTSWDAWLSGCIASSQEQLGEAWLPKYLSAPVWHFALSPGVIDQQGWAGLVMPSVDRVGRYYPLTLAWSIGRQNPVKVIGNSEFALKLENIVLDALEQGWNIEQLTDALSRIELAQLSVNSGPLLDQVSISLQETSALPQSAFDELLAPLLQDKYQSYSLWWTQGSQLLEPGLLCCQGLPKLGSFSALLDGNWQAVDWQPIQTGGRATIEAGDEVCL